MPSKEYYEKMKKDNEDWAEREFVHPTSEIQGGSDGAWAEYFDERAQEGDYAITAKQVRDRMDELKTEEDFFEVWRSLEAAFGNHINYDKHYLICTLRRSRALEVVKECRDMSEIPFENRLQVEIREGEHYKPLSGRYYLVLVEESPDGN